MLSTVTGAKLESRAITLLTALRTALEDCATEQTFLAALTPGAFVDMPLADAQAIFTAIADANALYRFYTAGQPPASYPQAASAYVYGASQVAVIGP